MTAPWDLNLLTAFVRVAELKSYTRASQLLGLPKSTLSRRVQELEELLGERLFERTTRSIGLTSAGMQLLERSAPLVQDLLDVVEEVKFCRQKMTGTLNLAVPVEFGVQYLAPCLAAFREKHPEVDFKITLTHNCPDMIEEGIDLAIIIQRQPLPDSSTLVKRLVGPSPRSVVTSPKWLSKYGKPHTVEDLQQHPVIVFQDEWPWILTHSEQGTVSLKFERKIFCNNITFTKKSVMEGLGFAMLPWLIAHEEIQRGELIPILTDWQPKPAYIHMVMPSRRTGSSRREHFADVLYRWLVRHPDFIRFCKLPSHEWAHV